MDANLIDDFRKNYSAPGNLPKLEKLMNKMKVSLNNDSTLQTQYTNEIVKKLLPMN